MAGLLVISNHYCSVIYSIFFFSSSGVKDHLQHGTLSLDSIDHAILDEADQMLDVGFAQDIEEIFSKIKSKERQTLLFSATLPEWVKSMMT